MKELRGDRFLDNYRTTRAQSKSARSDSRQRLEALMEERALARAIREGWDEEADDEEVLDATNWGEEE